MTNLHLLTTALAIASVASAATLSSNTYLWTQEEFGLVKQIELNITVLDNFQGDSSKQEWRYTVRNISYTASAPHEESGFGLTYFQVTMGPSVGSPFPNFGYGVGNQYASEGWHGSQTLMAMGALAWSTTSNNALLPGQTAVFGFSLSNLIAGPPGYSPGPRSVLNDPSGAFMMAWIPNTEFEMLPGIGGRADIPGAPVPEPASIWLISAGVAVLGIRRSFRSA